MMLPTFAQAATISLALCLDIVSGRPSFEPGLQLETHEALTTDHSNNLSQEELEMNALLLQLAQSLPDLLTESDIPAIASNPEALADLLDTMETIDDVHRLSSRFTSVDRHQRSLNSGSGSGSSLGSGATTTVLSTTVTTASTSTYSNGQVRVLSFILSTTVRLAQMSPSEQDSTKSSCRDRFLANRPELSDEDIHSVLLYESGTGRRRSSHPLSGYLMVDIRLKSTVTAEEFATAEATPFTAVVLAFSGTTRIIDPVFVSQSPTPAPTVSPPPPTDEDDDSLSTAAIIIVSIFSVLLIGFCLAVGILHRMGRRYDLYAKNADIIKMQECLQGDWEATPLNSINLIDPQSPTPSVNQNDAKQMTKEDFAERTTSLVASKIIS